MKILVDSQKKDQGQDLAELGPGSLLEVSEVFGRGYSSLFNSYVGLLSALEESRPLLLIGTSINEMSILSLIMMSFCRRGTY